MRGDELYQKLERLIANSRFVLRVHLDLKSTKIDFLRLHQPMVYTTEETNISRRISSESKRCDSGSCIG